jgi:hypothetical protein
VRTVSDADLKEAAESFAIHSHARSRIAAIGVGNGWRREGPTDGKRYSAVATTADPGAGAAARHLAPRPENRALLRSAIGRRCQRLRQHSVDDPPPAVTFRKSP